MWSKLTEPGKNTDSNEIVTPSDTYKCWPFTLAMVIVLAVFSLAGFYIIPTQAPFFLAKIGYPKPSTSAIMLATLTLCGGLVSLTYSFIRGRFGRAVTSAFGFTLFALGFGILSIAETLSLALVSAVSLGAATGLLFPVFLTMGLDVAPRKSQGLASGAVTTSIFTGQFLSPLTAKPLIETVGFPRTFAMVAGMFVVLGFIGLLVFRERKSEGVPLGRTV